MRIAGSAQKIIALFVAAFLLCGVLHVGLYGLFFADCITQLYAGAVTVIWALSVQKRVVDKRLNRLLFTAAIFLVFYYLMQIARYRLLVKQAPLYHLAWYAYYIPMMAVSLCCYYLAVNVNRVSDKPLRKAFYIPIVLGALITIGILTNDLHHFAFRFPTEKPDDLSVAGHGFLFYLYFAFYTVMLLLSFIIFLKKMPKESYKGYRWIPVIPPLCIGIYLLLNYFGKAPKFAGIPIWQMGEVFGFFMIAFFEACIRLGMIPANTGYEKLFAMTEMDAAILDHDGNPVYQTVGTKYPFTADGTTIINHHPIRGGSVEWAVDLSSVRELNRELEEKRQQLETRNAYLMNENEIQKEKAELETRHRLYDRIREVLTPHLDKVEQYASEDKLKKSLPLIGVLSAYIKRRSNMEILASTGLLSSEELFTAMKESLEVVKLNGINTAIRSSGISLYAPEVIFTAYQDFEEILETCFDSLSNLMVTIHAEETCLSLRILLQADGISLTPNAAAEKDFIKTLSVTTEEKDTNILLSYEIKGGAK